MLASKPGSHAGLLGRQGTKEAGTHCLAHPSAWPQIREGVMGTVLDLDFVDKETLQSGEAAQERMWLVKDPRPPSPGG